MAEDINQSIFPGSRRQLSLIGGGALALAVAILAIWFLVIRTPMETVFSGLKPADASLIVDELKRQKTPYELGDDGATIKVPSDQVDATRVAILGGDLPLKGTVGFELFSKSDMGLTEFAQKINYQRALQGELARTLMSMTNIESARVHITLPESGIFQDDHRPAKASVTITPKMGATVDGRTTVGVQRLVASAVEDLDAANVVVLDAAGKQLSADTSDLMSEASGTAGAGAIEQAYSGQVRRAIMQLVNDPAMRVTVMAPANAEIIAKGVGPATAQSGERSFPLRIAVALTNGPSPDLREKLVPLLQSLIGFDAALGDSLTLIRLPAASPYQVNTPVATTSGPMRTPADWSGRSSATAILWWMIACAVLVVAAALLAFRHFARREMTVAQHQSFAARLRELLDEDERLSGDQT